MQIIDLKKQRGELLIDIPSLNFVQGKIHGLFGGNGCGKSSLSKILIGDLKPEHGIIDYQGIKANEITLMPQKPYMLQRSIYENIIYPLKLRKMEINEDLIDNQLTRANLLSKKHQYAKTLSSGEQQKISFIRALIFKPKLIIIDETLSNLDIDSLTIFLNWILEWQQENKATWIIISHQLNQLKKVCDLYHYMKKGQIMASGKLEEVLNFVDKIEI